jgi:hypothetical protein
MTVIKKSQPGKSQVHVDRPLLNISVAYMQSPQAFVADRVFPMVEVSKQSDVYFVFDKRAFMTSEVRLRGDAEESHGSGYNVSTDTYYCKNWALHKDIGDQTRANTDSPLSSDRNAVQFLTHQHLINKELQWASAAFKTGVWSGLVTGASNTFWNDRINSDPISVIDTQKVEILKRTGRMPNVLVLGIQARNALKEHPLLVDRVKYTSDKVLPDAEIARLLGVDEVLTAYAVRDSAAEGKAAATDFVVSSKSALLLYRPATPSIETPSAGYTFSWSGLNGERAAGMKIRKFRRDENDADRVVADMAFDHKIVSPDAGTFFHNIVQ